MPYRVEIAKQGRAGCKNKECKDAAIKIQKGEFRYGTLITIQEHTSWTYKHWGCVTPQQVQNLISESGGDVDMVDGYDELPPEYQEKVQFALENGHVPDEDWKGDLECNRPGAKGFRVKVKTPKKKKGKKADEEDAEDDSPKPKKKRGRAVKDEDEDEAPAPKKARGRGKKAAVKNEEEASENEDEVPKAKVKKAAKGKKATAKKEPSEDEDEAVPEPEAPKPKRGRKKAADTEGEPKAVPQKRGRKKKAAVEDE